MQPNNISEYITYTEATKSDTAIKNGIKNNPNAIQLTAMKAVGKNVFDKVRIFVGNAVHISSFFRSVALNKKIGGSATSQHCLGEAIDIDCDRYGGKTNKEIFDYIKDNLDFDQLIWEFGTKDNPDWVHVSYSTVKNRKNILRAVRIKGKTIYQKY